jgi:GNAT superfamily N-acetyltransferase
MPSTPPSTTTADPRRRPGPGAARERMDRPVEHLDRSSTLAAAAELRVLYRTCFAAPPWCETEKELVAFGGRLAAAVARPGFRAVAARGERGAIRGVCYGWPTPAGLDGSPLYDRLREAFGAPAAMRLTDGAFEVAELMVDPRARGRGLGTALLTAAIGNWPRAWLLTLAEAPAARLYTRLGWRPAGQVPMDSDRVWTVFTWSAARPH